MHGSQHILSSHLSVNIAWFTSVPLADSVVKFPGDEVLLFREEIDGLLCIPVDLSSSYAPSFRPGNCSH